MIEPLQLTDRSWQEMTTIRLPMENCDSSSADASPDELEDINCDLSALMWGRGWPGDGTLMLGPMRLELHNAIVRGAWQRVAFEYQETARRLESWAHSGYKAQLEATDDRVLEVCRQVYGNAGPASQHALRTALIDLVDSGDHADAIAQCGSHTFGVHRCVLAFRCEYFAAAFKYKSLVELPTTLEPRLCALLLRYSYTLHRDELEALLNAACDDEDECQNGDEPLVVRLAFALDELLLVDAKSAAIARLVRSIDMCNAASLLAVSARLGSATLRVACLEMLSTCLDEARNDDPELFDTLVSPDVRRTIVELNRIANTNPVGRGTLTDAREAIAILRESLDDQTERLAIAQLRAVASRDRRITDVLAKRALRLDYLRDYVQTQESLLFGTTQATTATAHQTHGTDVNDWSYEWRPLSTEHIPPGLEVRLVFGGSRAARIPLVWQLKLLLPNGNYFRRQVTQRTTVADVLTDLTTASLVILGVRRANIYDGNTRVDPERNFDPTLWKHRNRLKVVFE